MILSKGRKKGKLVRKEKEDRRMTKEMGNRHCKESRAVGSGNPKNSSSLLPHYSFCLIKCWQGLKLKFPNS